MSILSDLSNAYETTDAKVLKDKGARGPVAPPLVITPIREQLVENNHEVLDIKAISKLTRPGDRSLEIGAGLEVISALIREAAPDVSMLSHEANPDLIVVIKDLHRRSKIKTIGLVHACLDQSPVSAISPFLIRLSFGESSLTEPEVSVRTIDVATEKFDDVVNQLQPDILVVDIERGEADHLIGADLSCSRTLILELHPKVLPQHGLAPLHDTCIAAGLVRRADLETGQVVLYEKPC